MSFPSVGQAILVIASRLWSVALHEAAHKMAAGALGYRARIRIGWPNSCTEVPGIAGWASGVVRHAGWLVSLGLAMLITGCGKEFAKQWCPLSAGWMWTVSVGCWWTALDAILSDGLLMVHPLVSCRSASFETLCLTPRWALYQGSQRGVARFFCGNVRHAPERCVHATHLSLPRILSELICNPLPLQFTLTQMLTNSFCHGSLAWCCSTALAPPW